MHLSFHQRINPLACIPGAAGLSAKTMNIKDLHSTIILHLKAAGDLLLPRKCIVCGRKLILHEKHLCMYCLADLPLTRFWNWSHNPMADKFNEVLEKSLVEAFYRGEGRYERYAYACALFFYDTEGEYRHITQQIKYLGNMQAGRFFGRKLGHKLAESPLYQDVDCIIPVPLHWRRKWKRGYNQAEVIAEGVASVMGVPLRTDILRRTRNTRTQTQLDVESKGRNVKGAFEAFEMATGCRHILLIDDIFTTGATMHACFEALREHIPGEVRISVATLGFVGH